MPTAQVMPIADAQRFMRAPVQHHQRDKIRRTISHALARQAVQE